MVIFQPWPQKGPGVELPLFTFQYGYISTLVWFLVQRFNVHLHSNMVIFQQIIRSC